MLSFYRLSPFPGGITPFSQLSIYIMRPRLNTTLGLLGIVTCIAVLLATYSAFESERGNPFLGLVVIVSSTAGVAAIRAAESVNRRRAEGATVTARTLSTTILKSGGVAAMIIGLANLAFLLAYGLLAGGTPLFSFPPAERHRYIVSEGLVAGTFAGLAVSYLSRRAFWRSIPSRGRLFRRLAPFVVVALLLGANLLWKRIEYRFEQAAYHDVLASVHGGESSVPAAAPAPPGFRPRPELAAYHARMKRKWEHAATHPWLPVEPDTGAAERGHSE
jgi:hypothetical protein